MIGNFWGDGILALDSRQSTYVHSSTYSDAYLDCGGGCFIISHNLNHHVYVYFPPTT